MSEQVHVNSSTIGLDYLPEGWKHIGYEIDGVQKKEVQEQLSSLGSDKIVVYVTEGNATDIYVV